MWCCCVDAHEMARRKSIAEASRDKVKAISLSDAELHELLLQADIPKTKRKACANDIISIIGRYNSLRVERVTKSEASQAETLQRFADAMRRACKAYTSLPPEERYAVQPDYVAFLSKPDTETEQSGDQDAANQDAADEALLRSITLAQFLADETVELPQIPLPAYPRDWGAGEMAELLSRARAPLPLELILPAWIDAAERRRAALEKQVSPGLSRRRESLMRKELAWGLKMIVMGCSPTFDNFDNDVSARLKIGWLGCLIPSIFNTLILRKIGKASGRCLAVAQSAPLLRAEGYFWSRFLYRERPRQTCRQCNYKCSTRRSCRHCGAQYVICHSR
jgi:hypothetical protein